MKYDLRDSIDINAGRFGLPASFVAAIVSVESSCNIYAMRYEPEYQYLWDVEKSHPIRVNDEISPTRFPHFSFTNSITEFVGQKISWGPMQIIGATARELGYKLEFPLLCGELGVEYGCKYLRVMADRWYDKYGWTGVAAAYNAGSVRIASTSDGAIAYANQRYVDKVMSKYEDKNDLD